MDDGNYCKKGSRGGLEAFGPGLSSRGVSIFLKEAQVSESNYIGESSRNGVRT